jgi:diacylglycerol O-acyltransferase / wax synthase
MPVTDRLTPLDASFLHLEDGRTHMHVGAVLVFEEPPPDYDEFVDYVEARLHLVPRYRQKLAEVPLAQARPRWIDDERFDIRYHVRATALPAPGGEHELQTLAARIFSRPLSRARPLWEMWLVEGLEGERSAVISKTHHSVVDGISGVDVLSALFAAEDEEGGRPWRPRREPAPIELLGEALYERVTAPAELLRFARSLVRGPRRALARVVGLGAMARAGLGPAPRSPYNVQIGPDRRLAWVRTPLEDIKAIKNARGGTVNDVVLTVVTRALRRHLGRRGEDLDELRAFVPVSVRADEQRGALGNEVAGMLVTLPIGCEEPISCLRQIADQTAEVKSSGQALGAEVLTGLAGFVPPTLLDQAARLTARQRFLNLVVTNVPGPQHPLYMGDKELDHMVPLVPIGPNVALAVAVLSYNGGICLELTGDFDALPDLDDLAGDLTAAIEELADAGGVATEPEPAGVTRAPG